MGIKILLLVASLLVSKIIMYIFSSLLLLYTLYVFRN